MGGSSVLARENRPQIQGLAKSSSPSRDVKNTLQTAVYSLQSIGPQARLLCYLSQSLIFRGFLPGEQGWKALPELRLQAVAPLI